ncbi:MAG: DegT/DnrJ/EryC1/StrS family aminotransferase, partial [bacterium]|nr:DegT/DnrJ/EryC1/StrS family aminotransferase [bacterium]
LFQLKRIKEFNNAREAISRIYIKELKKAPFVVPYAKSIPFLRFPVLVDRRDQLLSFLRQRGVSLGKWYSEVIDPKGVFLKNIFYQKGSCPKAEFFAKKIINLPTYPSMKIADVKKVVLLLKTYAQDKKDSK